MLLGEVVCKVGQKHRLALPKKFRDQLGATLVLTRGYEGCLVIVAVAAWQGLVAQIEDGSFLDADARESARFLFGGASEAKCDAQGRFVVPPTLYEHAGLSEEVVFVGLGRWVEVWDKGRWDEHTQQLARDGAMIAQRLAGVQRPASSGKEAN